MPCRFYTEGEEKAMAQEETRRVKRELDLATRLLCEMITHHSASLPGAWWSSEEVREWHKKHSEMDRKRKEAEALALTEQATRLAEEEKQWALVESAKNKQSPEELEALRKQR